MNKVCAFEGCHERLDDAHGNARYCCDAHKSAAWKAKAGYSLVGTVNACQTRKYEGRRRSGRQISYRKAVDAVATHLWCTSLCRFEDALEMAEDILHPALPEKQR